MQGRNLRQRLVFDQNMTTSFSKSRISRFNVSTKISAVICMVFLITSMGSYLLDPPEKYRLTITPEFHVHVFRGDLYLYSWDTPVCNLITTIGQMATCWGFTGVHYEGYHTDSESVCWTLSVSLFYPTVAAAVLPLIWLYRVQRRFSVIPLGMACL